jgi:two-component system OmpR family response regulator
VLEILIAEDERLLRESLAAKLAAAGFAVRAVRDGEQALKEFNAARPDLLLLDVMMPVAGGLEVCRAVRKTDPLIPVLFLTALDSESAELGALSAGGDVFISKTVSDDVLLARINAALRRKIESGVPGAFKFAG